MINPKNGEYTPNMVYNRKLNRGIIRAQVIKNNGYHNVSKIMSDTFKKMKEAYNEI